MGANCTISIANFGAVRVKATKVTHGMTVVAYNPSGESRHGSTFYSSKRVSGSFEMDVVFTSYYGYHTVSEWFKRYMTWAGNPRAFATPVRVQIPSRDFDKTGALEKGPSFGDQVGATSYTMTLGLVGARDPLEMGGKYVSQFNLPKVEDKSTPFFYPAGVQLTGQQNGWDTAYDGAVPGDDSQSDTPFGLPDVTLPGW